jgi:hypothetical protein
VKEKLHQEGVQAEYAIAEEIGGGSMSVHVGKVAQIKQWYISSQKTPIILETKMALTIPP